MNFFAARELAGAGRVVSTVYTSSTARNQMLHVFQTSRDGFDRAINIEATQSFEGSRSIEIESNDEVDVQDIDFVDDTLLNTAPHNRIEQQLLRGDVVGLALMSGAILWSAMGAFG